MLAATAADMNAEFIRQRLEPTLQGADDARRDARGVPVHAHDRAKRLEPEWMRKAAQQLVATVVMNDRLADDDAEAGIRSASQSGTRPPWSGRSALPALLAIRRPMGHSISVRGRALCIDGRRAGGPGNVGRPPISWR